MAQSDISYTLNSGGKKQRQAALVKLVQEKQVKVLEDFIPLLKEAGFRDVSPPTLSRDLREAKIAKDPVTKNYALSESFYIALFRDRLKQAVDENICQVHREFATFAVKTISGYARSTAELVQQSYPEEVLGTIAGDDMVLVFTKDADGLDTVAESIEKALES